MSHQLMLAYLRRLIHAFLIVEEELDSFSRTLTEDTLDANFQKYYHMSREVQLYRNEIKYVRKALNMPRAELELMIDNFQH